MKSPHDVHISLAPDEKYEPGVNEDDVYEFVVGGWANTKSVIRRGNQGRELATAPVSHPVLTFNLELVLLIPDTIYRLLTLYQLRNTEVSGFTQHW